jgi:hypothetical protein
VWAQKGARNHVTLTGGMTARGVGRANECCGPFTSDLDDRVQQWWLGARAGRLLTPRIGVDLDAAWSP